MDLGLRCRLLGLEQHQAGLGDFNRDGYVDAVAFYNYGGARTAAWIFRGNFNGADPPVRIWDSGAGDWDWNNQ